MDFLSENSHFLTPILNWELVCKMCEGCRFSNVITENITRYWGCIKSYRDE